MAKRRGRPKSDRPSIDYGTPELRAKRYAMVENGDPALSEHPLGLLMARGLLDHNTETNRHMYDAGIKFGVLWGRVFKPPFAESMLSQFVPGGLGADWTDAKLEEANAELKRIRTKLARRRVYDALVNCVIYRRLNHSKIGQLLVALRMLCEPQEMERAA